MLSAVSSRCSFPDVRENDSPVSRHITWTKNNGIRYSLAFTLYAYLAKQRDVELARARREKKKRKEERGEDKMMDRDEKLAQCDERGFTASSGGVSGRKGTKRRDDEEEDEEVQEEKEEAVSRVETKEGEKALRFFRTRDFETCLSALKSREIKEPRPKPGGRDRGTGEGEEEAMAAEGGARNTRRMARQTRRGVRQKVVRRSYTHHDSLSFVRSSYSRSSPSFFTISIACSASLPMKNVLYSTLRKLLNYRRHPIYRIVPSAIPIVSVVSSIAS